MIMSEAFYAITDVGPYRSYQVVLFDDADARDAGWIRSGFFRRIRTPVPREQERHILMPVVLKEA
jgi:hypothetical protein